MTRKPLLFLTLILLLTSACHSTSADVDSTADPAPIARFDRDLLAYVDADSTRATTLRDGLLRTYPEMLRILSLALFERPDTPTVDYFGHLSDYYNEPTLHRLYADALERYTDSAVDSLSRTSSAHT